jgi:hypothetical protein
MAPDVELVLPGGLPSTRHGPPIIAPEEAPSHPRYRERGGLTPERVLVWLLLLGLVLGGGGYGVYYVVLRVQAAEAVKELNRKIVASNDSEAELKIQTWKQWKDRSIRATRQHILDPQLPQLLREIERDRDEEIDRIERKAKEERDAMRRRFRSRFGDHPDMR